MYLWRRLASPEWWKKNETALQSRVGAKLAIIDRPGRKQFQLEVSSRLRREMRCLVKEFGGRFTKLRKDWLRSFSRAQKTKPLRIGKRLIITNVGATSASRDCAERTRSQHKATSYLHIPAGAAFGTGQHVTTAMCLRLLERVMRSGGSNPSRARFPPFVVDLGTGAGVLALAAKRFGAKRVVGIDVDPIAISTAKQNARLNRISGVDFHVDDVRRAKVGRWVEIVTANLFSELLIEILPKLQPIPWLILSGVMRDQERDLTHTLRQYRIDIIEVRRRGKWIAVLASGGSAAQSKK